MRFDQVRQLNDAVQFKATAEEQIAELMQKMSLLEDEIGKINAIISSINAPKRGPVPGLKALKERVEQLENDLKRGAG